MIPAKWPEIPGVHWFDHIDEYPIKNGLCWKDVNTRPSTIELRVRRADQLGPHARVWYVAEINLRATNQPIEDLKRLVEGLACIYYETEMKV